MTAPPPFSLALSRVRMGIREAARVSWMGPSSTASVLHHHRWFPVRISKLGVWISRPDRMPASKLLWAALLITNHLAAAREDSRRRQLEMLPEDRPGGEDPLKLSMLCLSPLLSGKPSLREEELLISKVIVNRANQDLVP